MRNPKLPQSILIAALALLGSLASAHAQFTLQPIWNVAPGTTANPNNSHPFLFTNNTHRGLSHNPVTGHLLVASRHPQGSNGVYVLSASNGDNLKALAVDPATVTGGTFPLNTVGVADDGVIYVGNLVTDSTGPTSPFRLYRWASEDAPVTLAFAGDPSGGNSANNNARFGDTMDVRGAGTNTQILLGSRGTVVALLRTSDGSNFVAQTFTTDVVAGDMYLGIAFGPTNSFWTKSAGRPLRRLIYNTSTSTATTVM